MKDLDALFKPGDIIEIRFSKDIFSTFFPNSYKTCILSIEPNSKLFRGIINISPFKLRDNYITNEVAFSFSIQENVVGEYIEVVSTDTSNFDTVIVKLYKNLTDIEESMYLNGVKLKYEDFI